MWIIEQEKPDGKTMQSKYKGTERDDETDEIQRDNGVWEAYWDDKRVVCTNNPNVEVYEEQRNNGGLP